MSTITSNRPTVAASNQGKRWGFRARGAAGAVVMAPLAVLAMLSPPVVSQGSWSAAGLDAFAWLVFLTGAAFRFWSTLYIGGRKTWSLVCEGPYSICRNPLYVGTFLLWIAVALVLKSVTVGLGVAAGILFYMLVTIPAEEKLLRETLGKPYEDFLATVPRLWPRFSLFHTPPTVTVGVAALFTECRRASRWIWLPVAAQIIAQLRSEAWWPHFFNLP